LFLAGFLSFFISFGNNVLERDYQQKLVIRNKLREIDAYPLLKVIEDHKGHMKEFIEELKKREPPQNIPIGQNLADLIQQ